MSSSIWDHCLLQSEVLGWIDDITSKAQRHQCTQSEAEEVGAADSAEDSDLNGSSSGNSSGVVHELQRSLVNAEQSCSKTLQLLDSILRLLSEVSNDYEDVTGRTNSLMRNCEHLLEQQVRG